MANDTDRDDNDNRDRFRNRDRNNDRGTPKREPEVAADPSIIWRIIRNYLMPIIQSVGTDVANTPAALKVLSSLENVVGEEGVQHAAVLGLPLVAAVIQEPIWLKKGLRQLGCPEEVNALIDEMIDEAFEGLRLGITDPKDATHKDIEKHFSGPSERVLQKLKDPSYEQMLRLLQPEEAKNIEQFFYFLPDAHKKRFNALKKQLASPADIRTLMGRLKLVQDTAIDLGHPLSAAELLEKVEQFYGITPAPAVVPNRPSPLGKLQQGAKAFLASIDQPVTPAEHAASDQRRADIRRHTNIVKFRRESRRF